MSRSRCFLRRGAFYFELSRIRWTHDFRVVPSTLLIDFPSTIELTWYKGKSTSAPGELRQYQVNGSTFLLTLVRRFANVNNRLFFKYTKMNLPNNIRNGDPDPHMAQLVKRWSKNRPVLGSSLGPCMHGLSIFALLPFCTRKGPPRLFAPTRSS